VEPKSALLALDLFGGVCQTWRFCLELPLIPSSTPSHDLARYEKFALAFGCSFLTNHQVLRFFRFRDYATVATATALSVPVGYIFGEMRHCTEFPIQYFAVIIYPCILNCFLYRAPHSWPCVLVCWCSRLDCWFHRRVPKLECKAVGLRRKC
jgi:hypothetical protein